MGVMDCLTNCYGTNDPHSLVVSNATWCHAYCIRRQPISLLGLHDVPRFSLASSVQVKSYALDDREFSRDRALQCSATSRSLSSGEEDACLRPLSTGLLVSCLQFRVLAELDQPVRASPSPSSGSRQASRRDRHHCSGRSRLGSV